MVQAPSFTDFAAIRGLQIAGTAVRLTSAGDILHGTALMLGRYGFLCALATGPESLRKAFNQSGFYRLQPETITLIDNTASFGHKETLTVSAGRGA